MKDFVFGKLFWTIALLAFVSGSAFGQLAGNITKKSDALEKIGTLKTKTSSQINSSKYGVGFECLDREMFDPSLYYDIAASLGVKWARCQTGWNRTEKVKGQYDWAWLDDVVDNLLKRGIQPWFNVGYGNKLYMSPVENRTAVGHVPLYYGDECLNAWKNYVRALAEHFKGRVKQFEIWNEPNIRTFWRNGDPKKSAAEYVRLIEISAEQIKSVIPDAKIGAAIAGGTSPYFKDIFKNGGGKTLDFLSIHSYRIVPEIGYKNSLEAMKTFIRNCGVKTEIRQGECGFPHNIPPNSWIAKWAWSRSSDDIQAKWMLRHSLLELTSGSDMSSYFMITDFTPKYNLGKRAQKETFDWGMTENGGSCRQRKVCAAMRSFLTIFSENVVAVERNVSLSLPNMPALAQVSRIGSLAANSACSSFDINGNPVFVYYMPEDLQMQSRIIEGAKLHYFTYPKQLEKPVLVDLMDGSIYRLKQGGDGVPITDYPLVVMSENALVELINYDVKR